MALPHRMGSVTALTIRRAPPQREQTSTSTAKPVWNTACHRMNWRPTRVTRCSPTRGPATCGSSPNVMERVALLSEARVVSAALLGLPAAPLEEGRDSGTCGAITLEESTRDHFLKTLNETNWNISRTAQRVGIGRNALGARIERYGLRPGVDASPLNQRARRPPVREPAGSVEGRTPPERPPR
jgi:transcriptional regulator with GAF, ATPase, and Fis domain